MIHSFIIDGISDIELPPKISSTQVIHKVTAAYIHPWVFVNHTSKKLAAIGALFSNDLCLCDIVFIIDDQQSTFSAASVVLGFMKTESSKVTNSSQSFALIATHHPLCSIFYYEEIVSIGNIHDSVHFAGNTGIVDRNNCFCLLCDSSFNQCFIDVHRIWSYIYKDNFGTS